MINYNFLTETLHEILLFLLGNARFPVGQISRNLNTTTSIGVAMETLGTEF